ncbi:MICOS complex subunit Mic10-like isoform X1 [Haliotis cracherodii]|uniref:MICOS complex subunit Mic10-like isoform X1 n=1 Tax=Haliotis rufescens TaxID=6454 RepID=UPI001EB0A44E|nr:MICOS complex subunit Mic10-like isoform X1 [Haliotis rufescens]
MASTSRSEDELGHKWDRCLSDTGIKIASGLGLGIVFSVVFFRRRPWPVAFGAGVGLGMGYANCQNDFQRPFRLGGKLVKVHEANSS